MIYPNHKQSIIALLIFMGSILGGCDQAGSTGSSTTGQNPVAGEMTSITATEIQPQAAPNPPPPATPLPSGQFSINPASVDFGIVGSNSKQLTTLLLHNGLSQSITIVETKVSCKCTVLRDISGTILSPGDSVELPASLQLTARPGEKTSKILIHYRGKSIDTWAQVQLRAEVQMAIRATPPYVDSLKEVTSGSLQIESINGQPFRVLSSNGQTPSLVGFNSSSDTPRNQYTLQWNTTGWECNGMRLWWIIETDHPDCPILPCRIRDECTGSRADPGRFTRGWILNESIVNAGALRPDEPVTLTIDLVRMSQNAPPLRLQSIQRVQSMNPSAVASLLNVTASDDSLTLTIQFTPDAAYRGMLYAMVNVVSDTGSHKIAVVASVRP